MRVETVRTDGAMGVTTGLEDIELVDTDLCAVANGQVGSTGLQPLNVAGSKKDSITVLGIKAGQRNRRSEPLLAINQKESV